MTQSPEEGLIASLRRLADDPATSRGVHNAIRLLTDELHIQVHHRASIAAASRYRDTRHLRIQLGSGNKLQKGWVNIDLQENADLQLDLRENLPFPDDSALIIYSEHLFEHLEYPGEAEHLLREALRVLEPGGIFSVGVPDAEETLIQYARGELPSLIRQWSADPDLAWFPPWVWTSPMHLVNFFFRQDGEHKHLYDFETLELVLRKAGFVDIRRREFSPELDSRDREDGTLYVDARKRGG